MIKILNQPGSITVREGTNATFSVRTEYVPDQDATGEEAPQISYLWSVTNNGGFTYTTVSSQYSHPNADGTMGSAITLERVKPEICNTIYKCTITAGEESVETMGALLIVVSNADITSNFKMDYTSLYTGEEVDEALRKVLGDTYDNYIIPGTRLVGRYYDEPADLNELDVPGVYTAHFYTHGPKELMNTNGNTPIQVAVFTSEDYEYSGVTSMFQTIITMSYATEDMNSVGIQEGSSLLYLYYRDLLDPETDLTAEGCGWQRLLLSNGSLKVINNLNSTDQYASLSANMGRYLKRLIDEDSVGVHNIVMSSGSRATDYSDSKFLSVWKQRARESLSGDIADSDTQGRLLFEANMSKVNGKLTYSTDIHPFDAEKFFTEFEDGDYVTIDTSNTHDDLYHAAAFTAAGTYAYMTKDEYDGKAFPTDTGYTASMWVKRTGNPNADAKIFIQLWLCTINSVDGKHEQVPIEYVYMNEHGFETDDEGDNDVGRTLYTSAATELEFTSGEFPTDKWVRVSATIDGASNIILQGLEGVAVYDTEGNPTGNTVRFDTTHVKVSFGIKGNASAQFKNFKLERGKVATDGSMTLAEMWSAFDNANFLRTVPIEKDVRMDTLDEKEGLVFHLNADFDEEDPWNSGVRGSWIKRHLTTGGGGGFVIQSYPPSETEVLWYVYPTKVNQQSTDETLYFTKTIAEWTTELLDVGYVTTLSMNGNELKCYGGAFYFYDDAGEQGPGWYPAESNYLVGNNPPANINKLWLNTNNGKYNEHEAPDMYYFDRTYNTWRIVGAEPRPSWVIQDVPPEAPSDDLMWITTSGIASVPYTRPDGTRIWLPIQSIWGHND